MRPPFKSSSTRLPSLNDTRDLLRALLRETAQSIAVITTLLPAPASTPPGPYHGATLSSFTSIALDPRPLVAFSLRVPSRMASALAHALPPSPAPSPAPTSTSTSSASAQFIINILSAAQPHLAERFARPDRHTHPFADPRVPYTTSQDGLPILSGALGALSCRLVGPSIPLAHLPEGHACGAPGPGQEREGEVQQVSGGTGLASELFIASVLRVEPVPLLEDSSELYTLPLLYHRRRYTTVGDYTTSES